MVGAKEQQTDQPCLGHVVGSAIERTYNVDDRLTGDREAFDKLVGRNTQLAIAATGATLLRRAMKDPEAFDLTSLVIKPNGTACYEYRAKNSFGAVLPSSAVLTKAGKMLTQSRTEMHSSVFGTRIALSAAVMRSLVWSRDLARSERSSFRWPVRNQI